MYKNISCIILSAGYSSRMQKCHKALLTFEEESKTVYMLDKLIQTFKKAGIEPVYVVLGHEEKSIRSAIEEKGCNIVINKDYDKGMFSSVVTGISALDDTIESSFLLPVDAALLKVSTISSMIKHRQKCRQENTGKSIIIPTFLSKCGHPPLIERKHFEAILQCQGEESNPDFRGLKGYFSSLLKDEEKKIFLANQVPEFVEENTSEIEFLPLCDLGILSDIDNDEEYAKALTLLTETSNRKYPYISEAFDLLMRADIPNRTKRHSCKVAMGALRLGLALSNALKKDFSLLNCLCGGLLHDICRTQRKHAIAGSDFLKTFQWYTLADIVASHTNPPAEFLKKIAIIPDEELESDEIHSSVDENDYFYPALCVYLADKFYSSDTHVTLIQRIESIKEKNVDRPFVLTMIEKRERIAREVEAYFNRLTGVNACECVEKESGHIYEQEALIFEKQSKIFSE